MWTTVSPIFVSCASEGLNVESSAWHSETQYLDVRCPKFANLAQVQVTEENGGGGGLGDGRSRHLVNDSGSMKESAQMSEGDTWLHDVYF